MNVESVAGMDVVSAMSLKALRKLPICGEASQRDTILSLGSAAPRKICNHSKPEEYLSCSLTRAGRTTGGGKGGPLRTVPSSNSFGSRYMTLRAAAVKGQSTSNLWSAFRSRKRGSSETAVVMTGSPGNPRRQIRRSLGHIFGKVATIEAIINAEELGRVLDNTISMFEVD